MTAAIDTCAHICAHTYNENNERSPLKFLDRQLHYIGDRSPSSLIQRNKHASTDACAHICAHTYENNERLPIQVFGLNLQNHLGNCSPSTDFFNLVRARSIPCDQLANSLDSTILSKNSLFSGEMVTFNDIFFWLTIYNKDSCEDLNIDNDNLPITKVTFVGGSENGKQRSISERAESQEERATGKRTRDPRDRMDKGSEQKYLHDRGVLPGIPHERGLVQGGSGRWRIGANTRHDSHGEVAPGICISVLMTVVT